MIANYTIERAKINYVHTKLSEKETVALILSIVEKVFEVTTDQILSSIRKKEYKDARHVARWFIYYYTDKSLLKTSYCTGGKEHSVILNSLGCVNDFVLTEKEFKRKFDLIKNEVDFRINRVKL
jgi:chromosomal replication initiation ATPase DnaA